MFRSYLLFLSAILAIVFSACNKTSNYSEFRDLPSKGWNRYDTIYFTVPISTQEPLNITLESRNNGQYPYQNLWLFVSCKCDSIVLFSDTVEVVLADKLGKWKGSGWGSLYELSIPYKSNFRFPKSNKSYVFKVVQGMRDFDLQGIESFGLRIEQ